MSRDRLVAYRTVGNPDKKPRSMYLRSQLKYLSHMLKRDLEWFDQPARTWRPVTKET